MRDAIWNLSLYPDRGAVQARNAGLAHSWVYAGPGHWRVPTWRATFTRCEELAERDHMGVIADVEDAREWAQHRAELAAVVEALDALASRGYSVGLTTIPSSHPVIAMLRPTRLWVSPQLYGVRVGEDGSPLTNQELLELGDRWLADFGAARVAPSLTAVRPVDSMQATYLTALSARWRGSLFWTHAPITPGSAQARWLAQWDPSRPFGLPPDSGAC